MKRKRLYKQMLHEAMKLYHDDFNLNKARRLTLKMIFLWPDA